MEGLLVAPEVAALVPAEDLERLRQAAASYTCAACGQVGRTPEQPAALVLLRDGLFTVAKLAHGACAPSAVFDVPGYQARVLAEAETSTSVVVAAWLFYSPGPARPSGLSPVIAGNVGRSLWIWQTLHGEIPPPGHAPPHTAERSRCRRVPRIWRPHRAIQ
ncbi:hypothetical protein ABT294_25630 [Nonomuraea sp. NPDC000554]|uniref:hypothetical protein n=1 Tax=Nonomuraea sp. NPDC000554 TaxID=3154259 RepID=UPI00331F07EB